MTPQQMASKLTVWSKHKIKFPDALKYAQDFIAGRLGDGLIKDYFLSFATQPCRIPTCTNQTHTKYCDACTNMIPSSTVVGLLKDLGEFLCGRQSV